MQKNHQIWRVWAQKLHRWGVDELVASLLDGLGPLTMIGAQVVYIGQPLLTGFVPGGHLQAMTDLLEDHEATGQFVALLREAG